MKVDYVIVGAGLAGSTVAELIANKLDKKVLVIEQRNHIAGNTYDHYNEEGILIQKYGPHIFHTSSQAVWDYLSRFTEWNNYVHRVIAKVNGMEVYLPINLDTMERLCDRSFTPAELQAYFDEHKIIPAEIKNSRDVIVSQVGEKLYELFFKNYTKKQWGVYPEELDPQVTKRLPVRFTRDTRYFTDAYQGIPKYGYTRMIDKMLDNKNIHLLLNTDYKDVVEHIAYEKLIYTGPIDYYFDFLHGKLPYRSLSFEFETVDCEQYQNAAVVNYPNEHEFTRITEFKQFYFQWHPKTTICREYPVDHGDPYYPIPKQEYLGLYQKYFLEAQKLKNIYFVGRLAQYRYMNMDEVVLEALNLLGRLC